MLCNYQGSPSYDQHSLETISKKLPVAHWQQVPRSADILYGSAGEKGLVGALMSQQCPTRQNKRLPHLSQADVHLQQISHPTSQTPREINQRNQGKKRENIMRSLFKEKPMTQPAIFRGTNLANGERSEQKDPYLIQKSMLSDPPNKNRRRAVLDNAINRILIKEAQKREEVMAITEKKQEIMKKYEVDHKKEKEINQEKIDQMIYDIIEQEEQVPAFNIPPEKYVNEGKTRRNNRVTNGKGRFGTVVLEGKQETKIVQHEEDNFDLRFTQTVQESSRKHKQVKIFDAIDNKDLT